jgi:hypothetical protein
MLAPIPPSDVLIHLLLSETFFSPLPLQTAEISSVGGVWIFSGTTHLLCLMPRSLLVKGRVLPLNGLTLIWER